MTALLLGSRLSQPGKQGLSNPLLDDKNDLDECHLALFKDGKWVQHDDEYYTALVLVLPKTHGRNAQMARSFTEMLFPHRDPKHIVDEEDFTDAIETSARGVLRQYFKRLKQTCSSLDANVSFPRCAAKIDEDPRSMKYGDRAKANRGFAEAFLRCRMAENLLKVGCPEESMRASMLWP